MPARIRKPGQTVPSVADFSVGGALKAPAAIGSAVGELPSMRSALRELINIVKQGGKKDPAKVFLAERQTGPRIGATPEITPPKGFHFGATDPRITRAPALVEKAKREKEFFKNIPKITPTQSRGSLARSPKPESVRSLEELGNQTHTEGPARHVSPPLLPKKATRLGTSTKYEPSLRRAVEADTKAGMNLQELVKKYPNVNRNTLSTWKTGG